MATPDYTITVLDHSGKLSPTEVHVTVAQQVHGWVAKYWLNWPDQGEPGTEVTDERGHPRLFPNRLEAEAHAIAAALKISRDQVG